MLLAVEGGGFFSSSASGYSKGLSLLLLGQKNEEKPMRVTPWSHYQLVNQETDTDPELASRKSRLVRGCASFVCFGRAAAGLESPSPLKVGPTQQQEVSPASCPASDEGKDTHSDSLVEDTNTSVKLSLKSSLRKPANSIAVPGGSANDCETVGETSNDAPDHILRRKVQWTDTSGGELFEIREFELRRVHCSLVFAVMKNQAMSMIAGMKGVVRARLCSLRLQRRFQPGCFRIERRVGEM
nr:GON-4-like protein [Ipomoea batatas]